MILVFWSSCLYLTSAGTVDVYHHTQLKYNSFKVKLNDYDYNDDDYCYYWCDAKDWIQSLSHAGCKPTLSYTSNSSFQFTLKIFIYLLLYACMIGDHRCHQACLANTFTHWTNHSQAHELPYNLGLYLAILTPTVNKQVCLIFTPLCINSRYVVYL